MISPVFSATVENGKLTLTNPEMFNGHLRSLEGEVTVTVKKRRKERSNEQNRYYWGVVVKILSAEWGWENPEQLHDALRLEFLTIDSVPLKTARSTTELSTVEMEDYLQRIRIWALAEHNIRIPLPNEIEYD